MSTPGEAVLVAHDGSDYAHRAVDAVARLFPGWPVIVLSVWDSATTFAPAHALTTAEGVHAYARVDKAAEEVAEAIAGEAAEHLRNAGISATAVTVGSHGGIARAILDYAERNDVGAVAVGSRGRSQIKSILVGSVANALVQRCPKPVLVVRDDDAGP